MMTIATLGLLLSQGSKLPGRTGALIRSNVDLNLETTALFYTEVDGWQDRSDR
tara:strand:+ start:406 stop:564 length:159 start_codon:yes stop_codon:yes gene_type:complete